jgi:hypothetical protein
MAITKAAEDGAKGSYMCIDRKYFWHQLLRMQSRQAWFPQFDS